MSSVDTGSAAPFLRSDTPTYRHVFRQPVAGAQVSVRSGTTVPTRQPGATPPPVGDLVPDLALAAMETAVRLARELPVRVVAGDLTVHLPGWPERLRRLDGASARATVREMFATPAAGESPATPAAGGPPATPGDPADGHLVVLLDSGASVEPPSGNPAVLLICQVDAEGITVTARGGPGDPWLPGLPAVAEIFAEVAGALLADRSLAPAAAEGIGAASRATALGAYAGHAVADGPFRAIPTLIEEQVDRTPHRPAVSFQGRRLTYRRLDLVANGLALRLTDAGVRAGDVVPVLLADGLELPVAYLALMKLGAAFVPFDPAWPDDRLRAALRVLAPRVVLAADNRPLPGDPSPRVVPVAIEDIAPHPERPGRSIGPDDLIYGIFTSGTTGVPKCAMNRHDGLANRFRFMTRYFAANGGEVVLQNSRHTFDSSVWQLFWPLTTGGRVVVPAQGEFLNLEHVIDTIAAERITITDFVPSIFNVLVSMVDRDPAALARLASLRHLIVGGEEINPSMVRRLRELRPQIRITNGYGPTETSIGMVFHPVSAADGDVIPIGRPIDNCYAVVADADLRPLPPGATGEILVGGVCLGTGYFAAPGRTAEVFVPNPLPEIPGSRLYRTGDLGHFAPDGRLYFAGRRDFQVKVNGVRLELGEIETAAAGCPGVRQAKALAVRRDGHTLLALFAESGEAAATGPATSEPAVAGPGGAAPVTEAAVAAHLRRVLPRINLPRHIFVLPALPLTANGKVDREQLRRLVERRLVEDAAQVAAGDAPATRTDRVLAVFRRVLGNPGLTADVDFRAAGGDSIQAVSLAVALTGETGVEIGVADLFAQPTPAGLAALVALRAAGDDRTEPEATLVERDAELPVGLVVAGVTRPRPPRTVLLTGGTGFVGSRLVHDLLADTDVRVSCLTRAADDAAATDRVVRALAGRGLWRPGFGDRLTGYAADLGRPDLGLSPRLWDHLGRTVDLVLHNGALVNFLFDYRAHRPANVHGTAELLRLAMHHRPVPLHYVSTLGVLDTEAVRWDEPVPEDHDPAHAVPPVSGYSRSKWVAERYLGAARRRGATVTVLRLGEVMPDADSGQPNRSALTHLLLAAFDRLGVRPAVSIRSDHTPVDYVSRRVVAAVLDPGVWGEPVHLFHPQSVDFADLPEPAGTGPDRVSCAEFLAVARAAATETGDAGLHTLLSLLPAPSSGDEEQLRRGFAALLVDNPRLFRRDRCARWEQRWGLADGHPLAPSMEAYRNWRARQAGDPDPDSGLLVPSGPQTR
ncbi:non-ribosomal peptide synthetase [Micromonospora echinofusca]|uniref:Amino acid adenylation domain-containing protein n=1 Tax=Micromonospora echinofusca TaxID=47858 RepID=A0ABS3VZC0_MICEH|nr:amino acid adenylation domain-containing protein [Micromonospora echinofusca]MBO4209879.1 amino acid adenylation domain-containing protein [Micromonospora echinofusca]